jgi:hypothetical protein
MVEVEQLFSAGFRSLQKLQHNNVNTDMLGLLVGTWTPDPDDVIADADDVTAKFVPVSKPYQKSKITIFRKDLVR